jgi:hypothetical protein
MDGSIGVRPSRSARLRLAPGFVAEIAAANPHMRGWDAETVVATIFDELASALARGDRWNCAALGLLPSDAGRRSYEPRASCQAYAQALLAEAYSRLWNRCQ